jgi:hypothetical protein
MSPIINVKIAIAVTLGIFLAADAAAKASTINLSLTETFNDGGTAFGSFTFDTSTQAVTNVNITTTAGSNFVGTNYTSSTLAGVSCDPGIPGCAFNIYITNPTGTTKSPTSRRRARGTFADRSATKRRRPTTAN